MIRATVKPFGEIRVLDRRYWAPELADKAGWEVELHFEEDRMAYPVVWSKGRQHRLCTAAQISDTGFADVEAARQAVARFRNERASVVGRDVAADADNVGKRLKLLCRRWLAIFNKLVGKHSRVADRQFGDLGRCPRCGCDMRQGQPFESVDSVGERDVHAKAPQGEGRNGFADEPETIAARIYAHRLSEISE